MVEIQSVKNTVFFSQISLFEIAIKQKIGKLPSFSSSLNEVYDQALQADFSFLSIKNQHIFSYHKVPLLDNHRDPFDRLLLATALDENAVILSADKNFALYSDLVQVFW
ncbi:MAG: PIN domain-containing protein [Methylobacter sp.]|nr:MAG: PIN domain-containing protein [Methylobacter sp.]